MNRSGINGNESVANGSSAPLPLKYLQHYGLAFLSVGVALGAALTLQHFQLRDAGVPLLLFAIAISSWHGGQGPAVFATILSIISFYWFFVEPVRTIYIYWSQIPYFIIFVTFAALISWFAAIRRRVEEAWRRSEAYLGEAQRLSHTGSWAFDVVSDKYVYVSEECLRIYEWDYAHEGLPDREVISRRIHPEDRGRVSFANVLREKVDTTDEYEIVLPSGTVKHVQTIKHPVLNSAGDVVRIVGTTIDITERRLAEEALRQSQAYLVEGQKLTHTGSWAFDVATGKYHYWSEEMFRIYGFDPQEGSPTREAVFRLILQQYLNGVEGSFQKSLCEKVDSADEYGIMLHDGTIKYVYVIRHPVLNHAGEVVQLVGSVVDVTERKLAEEAVRRSEAYLAEAQRLSQTGSWALDVASRRYVYWSQEMFRIYGFDPERGLLTREEAFRRLLPEDWNRVEANSQRSLREKVDTVDEYRIVLPDGTVKDLWMIRHPVLNDAGDVVQLIGTTVDITQRKRAEEALRRTAAYLADAQRLSHTGSWASDSAGRPSYWSEEMFRIFGFDPQQEVPTPDQPLQRVHPEDLDKFLGTFDRAVQAKVDFEVKPRLVLPDGTVKYIHGIGHPVLNAYGEIVEVVGTVIDITESKKAEEALRLAGAYNRSLIEASLDPLLTIDPEGKISDVNAATEGATGYTRSELIGTDFSDYFTDPEKARSGYRKVFSEGLVRDYELSICHRDGRITPVLSNASVYRDEAGKVIGVFVAARDITERKMAQEALQKLMAELESRVEKRTKQLSEANESLQAANKELESFSYSVSHDLRAPLRAIDGFSRMVLKRYADKLDDEGKRKLTVIRSNAQRMDDLINDLLAFSRMGRKEMLTAGLNMEALVWSVWKELTLVNPERRIQFSVQRLPRGMGDQALVKEVVSNLLSNAIKFTKYRENAVVEVGAYAEGERNVYFVKDNGVGFDMQYYDKLFGVFQRLHSDDEFEGTGVGLAIAERVIRRHGGRVWAEGKVNEGAIFYFALPQGTGDEGR